MNGAAGSKDTAAPGAVPALTPDRRQMEDRSPGRQVFNGLSAALGRRMRSSSRKKRSVVVAILFHSLTIDDAILPASCYRQLRGFSRSSSKT